MSRVDIEILTSSPVQQNDEVSNLSLPRVRASFSLDDPIVDSSPSHPRVGAVKQVSARKESAITGPSRIAQSRPFDEVFSSSQPESPPPKRRRSATGSVSVTKSSTSRARLAPAPAARSLSLSTKDTQHETSDSTKNTLSSGSIFEKKDTCREMVVQLPDDLGDDIVSSCEKKLTEIQVPYTMYSSPFPRTVKWKRRMRRRYNELNGCWEPQEMQMQDERIILCILSGEEFGNFARQGTDMTVSSFMARLKSAFPSMTYQFLLYGYPAFLRRNGLRRHKEFLAAMPTASNAIKAEARKNPSIDSILLEDTLLELETIYKVSVHQTAEAIDIPYWISSFTQYVSLSPYRRARESRMVAGFCMNNGQVATGNDTQETFVNMLEEVGRITGPMAQGLWKSFGGVKGLIKAFQDHGPTAVQNVPRAINRDGDEGGGFIGTHTSTRLYHCSWARTQCGWTYKIQATTLQ